MKKTLGRRKGNEGMTLVLALFVIVLLTMLIVGLLFQSQSSQKGSQLHVEALRSRQLAESAMSLVASRIQEATRTAAGDAWASQPGAIRVHNDTGSLKMIHKLYSAESGTTANAAAIDGDLPPEDWAAAPNLFVDLNAPYASGSGLSFPIVDPRLYSDQATTDPEGFSYKDTAANGAAIAGTVLPGGAADTQRLPMPVRWLYVLSNGEIVAPSDRGDGTVEVPGAGPDVEIIGRVAFWTDDETAKVNINTAAGGVFWDTPRTCTQSDRALANSQPVQGEFQRYPGHPSTVDLRAVFPWISSLNALYDFAPKIRAGGSNGGTVETSASTKPAPIIPDSDRLYAAPGEAKYRKDRSEFSTDPAFGAAFTDRVERGDFLLTSSSRAPELNLFGRPRIAIWPLDSTAANRSSLDKLIAMCATVREGGTTSQPYYFQRQDASSATNDYDNITRNRQLLAYLRTATGEAIPGYGGNFATKYTGPVRDQILTEVFDYIRGATNLKDPLGRKYADPVANSLLEPGEGQVTPIRITDWGTKGFGRFLTVGEAFFWFTWQGQGTIGANAADPAVAPATPLPATPPGANQVQIQAIFALNLVGQAVGYSEYAPDITIKIEGLNQLELNGVNMGFPATGTVRIDPLKDVPTSNIEDFRGMVRDKVFGRNGAANEFPFYSNIINVPSGSASVMTGASAPITISIYSGDTVAEANRIQTIELSVPTANVPVLQKLSTGEMAAYRLWGTGAASDRFSKNGHQGKRSEYMLDRDKTRSLVSLSGDHRLTAAFREVPSTYFIAHRGSAGNNPNSWTSSTAHVNSLMNPLARQGYPSAAVTGKLDAGASYPSASISRPYVATHIQGKPAGAAAWDWDTGMSDRADGAHINKPDEGSLGTTGSNKGSYFGGAEIGLESLDETMFLPNRQVSSAGMFGSLPTGIDPTDAAGSVPWQTLHLRPDPTNHPGNAAPRDHLLLDLFWMPVVEPYAISEPFSTAGKINMNSRLAPFSHITRETGLYAALRGEKLLTMAPADIDSYKNYQTTANKPRADLDVNQTLEGMRQRFNAGGTFLSPTEISSIYLVPKGQNYGGAAAFWATQTFTGDNVREKPYANLLAKLTTKSNSYSVHVVAQALKKVKTSGSDPEVFGQKGDQVTGEWRGTFLIERFLDPNNPNLPDFASAASLAAWDDPKYNGDHYYQTRVLQVKEWR